MQATLAGEVLDRVPSWTQAFTNESTVRRLMPADLLPEDLDQFPEAGGPQFEPHSAQELEKLLAFNRYIDKVATGVGRGTNCFGHGGPGEFAGWVVERRGETRIVEYETGTKLRIQDQPHFVHRFDMPVKDVTDLESLELPNPQDPARWEGFRQDVAYLKASGAYTVGYLNGFFSGCHYYFCDYQEFLMSLVANHALVEAVTARLGDWNLKAAHMMLSAGVDCISLADDLGSNAGLLLSPATYVRFFFPWHRALCDLAHSYGADVHLHSHGNINGILDRIVNIGVDMLNPLDPTEGMDLAGIKQRYGGRLTLVGGLDKFFFDQDLPEMERRLGKCIEAGHLGGRYIVMDASGIPETLSQSKFDAFLRVSCRLRQNGPARMHRQAD
jgi:uroporphyrinogen decarboxylase